MVEANQNVVRTAGLTKIFRDFWLREKVTAVADLSLEIRPREVFGLLGPNGSGKSTTLKMILGLLFPTRGVISVFDKPPTHVRAKARIGFLPEESNLYAFLDARETLDFYGRLFHLPRKTRRHRIDMLLEMVGLGSVAYRRVGEYSKGMQRRIGLAQALINDPDLLILDEPTSGLDPLGTRQFKDLIRTLAQRGKTVILSSHLLADVEDVCDRVCILYGGRQRAEGDVNDLLARAHQTQITTDQLDEATIQAVRNLLAQHGRELLNVQAPRDRLESLFLRIVEEAQRQKLVTGGAVATGRVADFLTAGKGEGHEVIESLLAGREEPAPEPESAEAPAESKPKTDEQVLTRLVVGPDAEAPTPETPAEPPKPAQADHGVIDNLLSKDNDEGGPSA
ncbi:MAG: ATP-binding cassette domain-containing protein [Phycisphaerae bacterium]|nr:ATP-binding cassette domain-containing protein [Phycisphaerae bacterium]